MTWNHSSTAKDTETQLSRLTCFHFSLPKTLMLLLFEPRTFQAFFFLVGHRFGPSLGFCFLKKATKKGWTYCIVPLSKSMFVETGCIRVLSLIFGVLLANFSWAFTITNLVSNSIIFLFRSSIGWIIAPFKCILCNFYKWWNKWVLNQN